MFIKKDNKAIIRRFHKSMNDVNYLNRRDNVKFRETGIKKLINNIFNEFYTRDCITHGINSDNSLKDTIKETISYFNTSLEIKTTVEDMIAQGDKVATRWTMHVTHKDTAHDIPSAGNKEIIKGITIRRIARGKISEEWLLANR